MQGELPVIDSLVIWIPSETPAGHTIFTSHLVDSRSAFFRHRVGILVHILRLYDLLCAVLGKEFEQVLQILQIICSGGGCKCSVHDRMRNISL